VFVFQQRIATSQLPRDWLFRIGERAIANTLLVGYGYGVATELTHSHVPHSDIIILMRITCKESPIR